ncbi:MAG: SH3 domain-containing protein, partial [Chitinophagaceae bacterium]
PIQQLVAAGEQSGNLSKTLITIGETFESRTDETTKNLTVLLEPILLVIVWGGVVSVALAVILPIYNLIGGLTSSRGSAPMEQTVHIDVPVDVPVAESIPNTLETQVPEEVSTQVSDTEESVSAENSVVPSVLTILGTETGYLNVRSGPDISYDVVGTVRPEEQYPFLQLLEGWYEIKLPDGVTGFVKADYVETETP